MPFTFKLSRRLARMKPWLGAVAVAALAACELPQRTATGADLPAVVQVVTIPDTVTLDPQQTRQFLAFGRTATGDSVAVQVHWSTSGGTITSSGLYRADTIAGDFTVTATATDAPVAGGSQVKNRGPLAAVILTPATATVAAGGARQFFAYGRRKNGDSVAVSAVYAATGGSVSPGGVYTAGAAAGTYRVIATQSGGTLADTAVVTVTTAPSADPGTVTDLAVASVSANAVTLAFTEVTDGTGLPARYVVRFTNGTLSWASASDVTQGTCAVPLAGTAIGSTRTCTVLGLAASTAYEFQLVAFRGTLNLDAVFGGLSNVALATTVASTAPVASVTVSPPTTSVGVSGTQQFTATLRDSAGNVLTGRPVAWTSDNPAVATMGAAGLATGVTVGVATMRAASEGQSGTATLTVTAPGSGGAVFESDWNTATGTSNTAVTDGGRWGNYWEFDPPSQLLSVVASGPAGYANALKVLQRGEPDAANVQVNNVVPRSTDFYVRFYMRNDDTSPAGDHIVTVDTWGYASLTFIRKYGSSSGWRFVSSFYGCGFTYPIGHWGPSPRLTNGAWYRFEYFIDFVDATHVQVHPRIYDANGTLILGDADFLQEDYGSATWNGRSDWTLASYYAAGHSFCVDPAAMTNFGMGNNGQSGAVNTGLAWYFAGIEIRTDRWPGP